MNATTQPIDVLVSFDTTGSMYPALTQVRRRVTEMTSQLFSEVSNLKLGVIAHGDYYDAPSTYVTKRLDFTNNQDALYEFISTVPATHGGDSPECYELVLREAQECFSWRPGSQRVLVMIGDDVPHMPYEPQNYRKLNWRDELTALGKLGVHVYGVQALARRHATPFYLELAEHTGGFRLELDQFANVTETILAVCYQQAGPIHLMNYEQTLVNQGRLNRSLEQNFGTLLGRSTGAAKPTTRFATPASLEAVAPGRFQAMLVDYDQPIATFVQRQGLLFAPGNGFYQLTKSETVQDHKQVVLRENLTGDLYSGKKARALLGLPEKGSINISTKHVPAGYTAFVQSTSYNRKLIGGTEFLYEVDFSR